MPEEARRGPGSLHVLYLAYWGAAEPLGQSLILPAIARLSRMGVRFTLVTFEKPGHLAQGEVVARIRSGFEAAGVRWTALRYHKRPNLPAKMFDIVQGTTRAVLAGITDTVDLVHARTFMAGPMGLLAARLLRVPFVYHNEGFYPDEQVDGGVWKKDSPIHRLARRIEGTLYDRAAGLVVLSKRARQIVSARPAVARGQTPL